MLLSPQLMLRWLQHQLLGGDKWKKIRKYVNNESHEDKSSCMWFSLSCSYSRPPKLSRLASHKRNHCKKDRGCYVHQTVICGHFYILAWTSLKITISKNNFKAKYRPLSGPKMHPTCDWSWLFDCSAEINSTESEPCPANAYHAWHYKTLVEHQLCRIANLYLYIFVRLYKSH